MSENKSYDYVIIGGGSAGSVLGNRLSEDKDKEVLVLEAGRSDYPWDLFIQMPAALMFPSGNKFYDWIYETEEEPHMGRKVDHARGKVLGGSSSINGMIYQRGNPMDYEGWAEPEGMETWDFAHCLPYFKRLEKTYGAAPYDKFRGHSGPIKLKRGPATNPLFKSFFDAGVEAGYHKTKDVNGYRQEGFGPFDSQVHNGRRVSASRAYLHPAMRRKNLTVKTRAFVTEIHFDGNKATGVTFKRNGKLHTVEAGEVILSGGAFNTPQLLQLSGIGDAEFLKSKGIEPRMHLPGVGENFEDHLEVYIQHKCKQPVSLQPSLDIKRMPWIGLQWIFARKGAAASNHFEGGGFVRSNDQVDYPNLMFHFLPIAVRYDGQKAPVAHGYQVHVGPMYSNSRGSLKIKSKDPFEKPSIVFNYLSTKEDEQEWVEAIRVARNILSQHAMDPFNGGEISPGPSVQTDEEILDWVRKDGETALHPSCSAKMGPASDPMAVVDPLTMKVYGMENLRVVDASAMPRTTNGNIHAPVLMLAEKAADIIRGKEPLEPQYVDYYKHGVSDEKAGAMEFDPYYKH
ncbi:choline dehydrogenase [Staphylococcus devriesei]|uniref:Oxygen-dependent choline dehydrogenase n=1 Tax=Staphylococcus devriesei TaxID=586733 RepID=A0A2K4DMV3_9STAP|nr:choline dehydrogenase [Staphylococcus devriesei]MCE5097059.1 choline dehydrogenase [Staphylococcus devriesei]PNZ88108.1 choline dehydrogenase [Staphylococcus devriesei]PTE74297.1 choline dehydrogenase [Staphylococcus devriesei]PTF04924.1 choline dehydrogenase [Staphylococcus devriesei]PTF14892.1 choline dehydrogenase [Staphylococcus devriesei]